MILSIFQLLFSSHGCATTPLACKYPFTSHTQRPKWKNDAANTAASNILIGATATSEEDAQAVGEFLNGVGAQPLIEHWNGVKWRIVHSPTP
jgi:hypothetical protein